MPYVQTEVEVDLDLFDTNNLIEELEFRHLSKNQCKQLLRIAADADAPPISSLFSATLIGEDVYNALVELTKRKSELELLELFEKAK